MEVYRITHIKWSSNLIASGKGGRWNSEGKNIIYTASSRALACLENVVHRSGEGLNSLFKVIVIHIPDELKKGIVDLQSLSEEWYKFERYSECRLIGNEWYRKSECAILEVPSAIIPNEKNYLINTDHSDFCKIHIISREDFRFDPRITFEETER
ncbi:MAG: RES family NAD+ phosphorylase [Bacteroidetes bacterium]|nr:RES family NAD+ phosphorylase [Bacteroidota bacterium]